MRQGTHTRRDKNKTVQKVPTVNDLFSTGIAAGYTHEKGLKQDSSEYLQLMTYFNGHCGRVYTREGTKTRQCRENLQLMILMQQPLEQSTHSRRDWNKTVDS